ncbi:uncharacterized protein MG328-like [Bombus flavifrons]|uniref:uncharacterized protein MG328-like n=1 Tax=Bombus flavifrons TaxID=103934 RepID=UPI0037037574
MKQALQAEINKLKNELAKAKQECDALLNENNSIEKQLEQAMDEPRYSLDEMELENDSLKRDMKALRDDLEDSRRQAEVLKAAADASKAAKDKELELCKVATASSLKDGLDNCADEMRKLRTDSDQLKLENRAFESDIPELDDRLTKEIANLKARNAGLEQKLEALDKWKSRNADLLGSLKNGLDKCAGVVEV